MTDQTSQQDREAFELTFCANSQFLRARDPGGAYFNPVTFRRWEAWQAALKHAQQAVEPFQQRVQPWMMECFGPEIAADTQERNHRFLEESLELVQACGATQSEAHQLVDYVYSRPVGDKSQEVGGVMVTLAALCLAQGLDMDQAGDTELARIWTKVEQIRAKQAAKPKHSPLPMAVESELDKVLPYPDTLCPDLAEILGKPNFWCGPIAHVFQAAGYEIPKKAEAEQAFVIHWLVNIYLRHGANWRAVAGKELNDLVSKLKSQQPAQADKDKP